MKTQDLKVGDEIYNGGDMANPSHFGKIIDIRSDKWGTHIKIQPEEESSRKAYTVDDCIFSPEYKGTGLTRIVLKSAYTAWRENQLDQLMNRRGIKC